MKDILHVLLWSAIVVMDKYTWTASSSVMVMITPPLLFFTSGQRIFMDVACRFQTKAQNGPNLILKNGPKCVKILSKGGKQVQRRGPIEL